MLSRKDPQAGKYTFAKVEVDVGNGRSFVLSRYILARILTTAGVEFRESSQIAFDLKKVIVDNPIYYNDENKTISITQSDLQILVKDLLREREKEEKIVQNYTMISKFNKKHIPVLVLLFGSGCVGKSTIANRLSEVINISTVFSTDLIFELQHIMNPLKMPCWFEKFSSSEEFLKNYELQCSQVRKGLEGDIKKCFLNGKSMIVYGNDLNPLLFEDVLTKYRISRETCSEDSRGIILPYFLNAPDEKLYERFFEKFCQRRNLKQHEVDDLREKYKLMREFLKNQNPKKYELDYCDVNFLSIKKTIETIHKKFLTQVELVASWLDEI